MKLTTEQIAIIDETLVLNGVVYDDLKIEVLDHIASEIENEMEVTEKDFQEVCKQVFERWNGEFKLTRAFFSLNTYYPKLAKSKFGNQLKSELIVALLFSLLLFFSFQLISDSNTKLQFLFWVKQLLLYTYIASMLFSFIFKYFIFKSKITSTYKQLFDNRFAVVIVFLNMIFFNDNIPQDVTNQNLFVVTIGCLFVYIISVVYLGFKHFKFENKINMI
jgi:hypothetical protein